MAQARADSLQRAQEIERVRKAAEEAARVQAELENKRLAEEEAKEKLKKRKKNYRNTKSIS